MSSQTVASVLVLVGLQLLVLRASQHAVPNLYFTTSSLFDRRADVSGGAVLFRLSVPFVTGAVAALLAPEDEFLVGAVSGGLCWFLVIWPIIWNPRLVSHRFHLPFVAVLVVFWIAYATLPLAGAALVHIVSDVISGDAAGWQAEYVWAVITGIPISVLVKVVSSFAARKMSFVGDSSEASESSSEERKEEDLDDWELPAILGDPPVFALVGAVTGIVLIALIRLVGSRRSGGDKRRCTRIMG